MSAEKHDEEEAATVASLPDEMFDCGGSAAVSEEDAEQFYGEALGSQAVTVDDDGVPCDERV